mmetsp:Transcript_124295/g.247775  ORF Transcript_124295/g.247775 Transcript_124295/m.247775 type:complete len:401 (-) Transcript_124295:23-1225(-)
MAGTMRFAKRITGIPNSGIRDVMRKAIALEAAGKDVIHWHIGRPGFDTPTHIKQACTAALSAGHVHYAPTNGIPALRAAIAAQTEKEYGAASGSIHPDRIVVCNGGMEAVTIIFSSILEDDDEVVLPSPNWPNIKWAVALAGGRPVDVPLSHGFLTAESIEASLTERTKAVVLSSPGNPTGTVMPASELQRVAALALQRDLLIISDETYSRLYYGSNDHEATAPSIMQVSGMTERTVVLNTMSKTYAMDGWRLGWAICPSVSDATLVSKTRYYVSACSPTFTQYAAVAALNGPQDCVAEMLAEYDERRRILIEGLTSIPQIKLSGCSPEGAFYVFPDVSAYGPSAELAKTLLDQYHLAVIDGGVFGAQGDGHLRIAYTCSTDDCRRGVERLANALSTIGG